MDQPYHIPLLVEFCRRLESADVPYLIGGSIASSIYGDPRLTHDADVEVRLDASSVSRLIEALDDPFYISEDDVREAVGSSRPFASFQVLNMDEAFKFDCFLHGRAPFDAEASEYARRIDLPGYGTLRFAAPEHIFVQKVRWFELGNRSSQQQWRDMIAVARNTAEFDETLVRRWAGQVGLGELADELLEEARRGA